MSLPAPNLDDRRFQDLVDDAKRLVQRRCPEWSDHNVSDPGVTLVEAFATMVDQLLYRLNRVPERHYLRFLDLVGVRLFPPTAARTQVTFWLSAPLPETVLLHAATELATVRTELDEAVVFTTVEDLAVVPCELAYVAGSEGGRTPVDHSIELRDGQDVGCFAATPAPGDAFYVGLTNAVPSCAVMLRFDCRVEGIGVDPTDPPVRWEAWDGETWQPCEIERDETGGLNRSGDLVLHLPARHVPSVIAQQRAGWLRCLLLEPEPGQTFYSAPPIVTSLEVATIGATTNAVHAEPVTAEELGRSDGSPGQRFALRRQPVVDTGEPEVLEVGGDGGWETWTLVGDFTDSTAEDRHFQLDRQSGEVAFGPAVRNPDGTVRRYGGVPPKDAMLRLRRYHTGGGTAGNVAPHALRVLKTSIPFVSGVDNRRPASGGVDGETVADAMVRGPLDLRSRHRAVTAEDYELLAREAAPELARIHCVPVAAGSPEAGAGEANVVRLLVVPALSHDPATQLEFLRLRPDDGVLARVAAHLETRRALGTRLVVEPPFYRGLTVVARITAQHTTAPGRLRREALAALYRYLDPLVGGPRETGWPLGTAVRAGDLHACLQRVHGVDSVDDIRLYLADPVQGTRADVPVQRLDLGATELVFSFEHQVLVQ
ncbi:putative baseplate assembly protein [Actinopolymorpha pittospori]